jgi:hypothetical protein
MREMQRARPTPAGIVATASAAVAAAGFRGKWGANADLAKTTTDLDRAAGAGFTMLTLDPSAHLESRADRMSGGELDEQVAAIEKEAILPADWMSAFLGRAFEIPDREPLRFEEPELKRAAVKFGRALVHLQRLARHLDQTRETGTWELEASLHETAGPMSALEHLFCAMEFQRRGLRPVALSLRLGGRFEAGADFEGDLVTLEEEVRIHAAIAARHGRYKITIRNGGCKDRALPVLGRACGELIHVKTSGTSYIEALRVVCRVAPDLLREIAGFARERFDADRDPLQVSTTAADADRALRRALSAGLEPALLDADAGRQLLLATCGAVLSTGETARGHPFRDAIADVLRDHADLHRDVLDRCFTRHLALLNAG